MELYKVRPSEIVIGSRLRGLDDEKVAALARSIDSLGLQTPISVWEDEDGDEIHLVAGAHRLAAVQQLGWEEIDCNLVSMTELDRKRWEIAENLHRSELTTLQRDEHIAEWVRLTDESEKLTQVGPVSVSGGRGKTGGVRKAAREIGIAKTDAQRAVKVDSLSDDAKDAAKDFGLDNNRTALLRAASKPESEQVVEIHRIAEEKAAPKQESDDFYGQDEDDFTAEDEASYETLIDAWSEATPAARNQFLTCELKVA